MLPPVSPHFLEWIERFERHLARILALVLILALVATSLQLLLFTGLELFSLEQGWLNGGLLRLLDRILLLLIGLEVLQNVTAYLKDHEIQIELVLLTALTAVARKVIVLSPGTENKALLMVGFGLIVVGIAAAYWLVRAAGQARANTDPEAAERGSAQLMQRESGALIRFADLLNR